MLNGLQGSILGPVLFMTFNIEILYFIDDDLFFLNLIYIGFSIKGVCYKQLIFDTKKDAFRRFIGFPRIALLNRVKAVIKGI